MKTHLLLLRRIGYYLVAILVLPGALIGAPILALMERYAGRKTAASEGFEHPATDGHRGL